MSLQEVLRWLGQTPFIPFRLSLSNGRHYDVTSRDMVFPGKSHLIIGDLDPDLPLPVFNTAASVGLIHINDIEPIPAPTPPAAA